MSKPWQKKTLMKSCKSKHAHPTQNSNEFRFLDSFNYLGSCDTGPIHSVERIKLLFTNWINLFILKTANLMRIKYKCSIQSVGKNDVLTIVRSVKRETNTSAQVSNNKVSFTGAVTFERWFTYLLFVSQIIFLFVWNSKILQNIMSLY